jgi:hypothetical protein
MAGQLCYRLNTSRLPAASGSRVRHSLMLLVDLNEEMSSALTASDQQDPDLVLHGMDLSEVPAAGQAAITVHTLSPFTGYGPGHYRMTVLKQTTGSDNFLKLTDKKKKCKVGPDETIAMVQLS